MSDHTRNPEPTAPATRRIPGDDYLWDKSGADDPAIKSLEDALAQFSLSSDPSSLAARERSSASRRTTIRVVGGTLLVAIAVTAAWLWLRGGGKDVSIPKAPEVVRPRETPPEPRTVQVALAARWDVVGDSGSTKIGERTIEKLPLTFSGRWIETGPTVAAMRSGAGATLEIRPNSRVRVSSPDEAERSGTDPKGPPAELLIESGGVSLDTPSSASVLVGAGPRTIILRPSSKLIVNSDAKAGTLIRIDAGQADAGGRGERSGGRFGVRLLGQMELRIDSHGDLTVPSDGLRSKQGDEFAKSMAPLALAFEGRSKLTPEDVLGPALSASRPENAAVLWNVMSLLENPTAQREVALRITKLIDEQSHRVGGEKVPPIAVPDVVNAEFADRLWKAIVALRPGR